MRRVMVDILDQPSLADRPLFRYVLPGLLAIMVGLLVAADPLMGYLFPQRAFYPWLNRLMPYLFTLAFTVALAGGYWLFTRREWIFQRRYTIAAVLLVVTAGFEALNKGQLKASGLAFLSVTFFYLMALCVEHRPFRTPLIVTFMMLGLAAFCFVSIVNGAVVSILAQYSHMNKITMVFVMTNIVTTPSRHRTAIKWLIATVIVSAIFGIAFQAIYQIWGFPITFDPRPEYQYKNTPFGRMLRTTAFFTTTQGFAHLLLIGLPLVLFARLRWYWKTLLAGIIVVADICTFNPGSMLVIAMTFAIWLYLRWPHRSIHFTAAAAGATVILYLTGILAWAYRNVLLMLSGDNVNDRVEYMQNAFDAVGRHPFLGHGLKNIERVSSSPIHNVYMQMTADIGIIGGAIFACFVLYLIVSSWKLAASAPTPATANYFKGLLLAMIAMATHFMIEPFYDNYLSWMFMALVASAIAIAGRPSEVRQVSYANPN